MKKETVAIILAVLAAILVFYYGFTRPDLFDNATATTYSTASGITITMPSDYDPGKVTVDGERLEFVEVDQSTD